MTYRIRPPKSGDGLAAGRIIMDWANETPWITEFVDDDLERMASFWQGLFDEAPTWIAENDTGMVGFSSAGGGVKRGSSRLLFFLPTKDILHPKTEQPSDQKSAL